MTLAAGCTPSLLIHGEVLCISCSASPFEDCLMLLQVGLWLAIRLHPFSVTTVFGSNLPNAAFQKNVFNKICFIACPLLNVTHRQTANDMLSGGVPESHWRKEVVFTEDCFALDQLDSFICFELYQSDSFEHTGRQSLCSILGRHFPVRHVQILTYETFHHTTMTVVFFVT